MGAKAALAGACCSTSGLAGRCDSLGGAAPPPSCESSAYAVPPCLRHTCAAAALSVLLAAVGCAGERTVPAGCRSEPAAIQAALRAAPAPVRLDGAPISACFVPSSDASEVTRLGSALLPVATSLGERARAQPDGPAALRLGYLVGAVRRGAGGTQGIYAELVRRIEQEVVSLDVRSRAFRRGQRAGRTTG